MAAIKFEEVVTVNGVEIVTETDFGVDGTEIHRFPTLYKIDKLNRTSFWRIYVIGSKYYRESGLVGRKVKQYEPVTGVPKNVGRSNATTPEQQAMFEAFSEWKHKKNQLYTEEEPEEGGGTVDSVGVSDRLRPMLAEKFEERKKYVKWPCAVSPKLDGVRVMVYPEGQPAEIKEATASTVRIISRLGKMYEYLNGIREEALTVLKKYNCVLDGELYTHNLPFNAISGAARSTNKPSKYDDQLEMYVFDMYFPDKPNMPYKDRMEIMRKVCELQDFKRLRFLFYEQADSEADVKKKHNEFVEQGYEGAIVRNFDSVYRLGRRVNDLLKYKEFEDAEFSVIDVVEGVGTEKGAAIFVCQTADKQTFSVRPRGSIEKRRKQLKNKALFVGKQLTVRYQPLTKEDKLPRFPVGIKFDTKVEESFHMVEFRDYE